MAPLFLPGDVVKLHGLESESGKKMNGRTAVVLKPADDSVPRFQLHVKHAAGTVAIKPNNLTLQDKLPLPDLNDDQRGIVSGQEGELKARKFVELLVRYENGYRMSEITFTGEASAHFMKLGRFNFLGLCNYQIEQLGGMCGLTAMCQDGEGEEVLFALLEANTMCLDCILIFIYQTHLIAPEEVWDNISREVEDSFRTNSFEDFTPDQERDCYIRTLAKGPLGLLEQMALNPYGVAFVCAVKRTRFPHMLARRLLRLIAREAMDTPDGKRLGESSRLILSVLCKEELDEDIITSLRNGPVSTHVAKVLMEREKELVSPETMKKEVNDFFL